MQTEWKELDDRTPGCFVVFSPSGEEPSYHGGLHAAVETATAGRVPLPPCIRPSLAQEFAFGKAAAAVPASPGLDRLCSLRLSSQGTGLTLTQSLSDGRTKRFKVVAFPCAAAETPFTEQSEGTCRPPDVPVFLRSTSTEFVTRSSLAYRSLTDALRGFLGDGFVGGWAREGRRVDEKADFVTVDQRAGPVTFAADLGDDGQPPYEMLEQEAPPMSRGSSGYELMQHEARPRAAAGAAPSDSGRGPAGAAGDAGASASSPGGGRLTTSQPAALPSPEEVARQSVPPGAGGTPRYEEATEPTVPTVPLTTGYGAAERKEDDETAEPPAKSAEHSSAPAKGAASQAQPSATHAPPPPPLALAGAGRPGSAPQLDHEPTAEDKEGGLMAAALAVARCLGTQGLRRLRDEIDDMLRTRASSPAAGALIAPWWRPSLQGTQSARSGFDGYDVDPDDAFGCIAGPADDEAAPSPCFGAMGDGIVADRGWAAGGPGAVSPAPAGREHRAPASASTGSPATRGSAPLPKQGVAEPVDHDDDYAEES